jgi:hypothetical protein
MTLQPAGTTARPAVLATGEAADQVTTLIGDAVRTLAPAFSAIRRSNKMVVVNELRSVFQVLIGISALHEFEVTVAGILHDEIIITAGVTCGEINVATADYHNLIRSLSDYFGTSMKIFHLQDDKLCFTLPASALF